MFKPNNEINSFGNHVSYKRLLRNLFMSVKKNKSESYTQNSLSVLKLLNTHLSVIKKPALSSVICFLRSYNINNYGSSSIKHLINFTSYKFKVYPKSRK